MSFVNTLQAEAFSIAETTYPCFIHLDDCSSGKLQYDTATGVAWGATSGLRRCEKLGPLWKILNKNAQKGT